MSLSCVARLLLLTPADNIKSLLLTRERESSTASRYGVRLLLLTIIVSFSIHSPLLSQSPKYNVVQVEKAFWNAALNDSAEVVGLIDVGGGGAFFWKRGVTTVLPFLPGGHYAFAYDINNNSVIVGTCDDAVKNRHAVYWSGGSPVSFIQDPRFEDSDAWGINAGGVIVGNARDTANAYYGFIYNGSLTVIPSDEDYKFMKINDGGYILYDQGVYYNGTWTNFGIATECLLLGRMSRHAFPPCLMHMVLHPASAPAGLKSWSAIRLCRNTRDIRGLIHECLDFG